jgi:hypothetical protein
VLFVIVNYPRKVFLLSDISKSSEPWDSAIFRLKSVGSLLGLVFAGCFLPLLSEASSIAILV